LGGYLDIITGDRNLIEFSLICHTEPVNKSSSATLSARHMFSYCMQFYFLAASKWCSENSNGKFSPNKE
jgi:hypothetical protein